MKKLASIMQAILSYVALFLGWLLAHYIFRFRNKIEIIGRENLLHTTGILYLASHETLVDSFLIGIAVLTWREILFFPRRIPWNAPDGNNFFKHPIGRHIFALLKNIPVTRQTRNRGVMQKQIERFRQAVTKSNLLLFFEGTRTRNGKIGECKTGVVKTILSAQPKYIVPILLSNVQPLMPIDVGFNFLRIKRGVRGKIVIGQPVDFSDLYTHSHNGITRKLVGNRVREAVVSLQTRL
ncbi:MAG: hypothetical protein COV55_00230 [Candidatus Komeilibacteria bacterium CG11_big_fil_rev_8_21_14_0_20_36_20]|uniref:Phospholipid/glycerol acyltransferase domain-containing protein n=1 Tax=Candidatus Komeilibacteria bacterium CG11_big_fil_rev_8_21_14_0_20_36_20 TaxID=1974477 RepID=A0A2H0NGN1_9BACT|nr:MAG: hypothetical protein COV55_00230 [Candidatus Komeilibacteria bacterium CG11_big_fil_rev_8_21_14_0_20_36_20]PIR81540.1 MAG: hypothetical protein COU21_03120 [Candidatus Komeilibacteria bacterium CG10_big_fil_rev_8_21_14_0_10_36_65]PJC55448.1 MAG: hypothetical protein CO027_01955 [Candidatus Komeilibacteria bacterium CG_4_9_14_0_2_um_filter_36_13]